MTESLGEEIFPLFHPPVFFSSFSPFLFHSLFQHRWRKGERREKEGNDETFAPSSPHHLVHGIKFLFCVIFFPSFPSSSFFSTSDDQNSLPVYFLFSFSLIITEKEKERKRERRRKKKERGKKKERKKEGRRKQDFPELFSPSFSEITSVASSSSDGENCLVYSLLLSFFFFLSLF